MHIHAVKVVDKTACLNVRKVVLRLVPVVVAEVAVVTVREIVLELAEEDVAMAVPEAAQEEICLLLFKGDNGVDKRQSGRMARWYSQEYYFYSN